MENPIAGVYNKPVLSGTRMIVVTSGVRKTELYAMLCSVLSNVSQLQVKVLFHCNKQASILNVRSLQRIAELNRNLLSFACADESKSVAAVLASEIIDIRSDPFVRRVISADDDHLFDRRCFEAYSAMAACQDAGFAQGCILTPCVVDIADAHGYEDWQASPRAFHYGAFESFVKEFGLASAAHQNWACRNVMTAVDSGYINNCWMIPVKLFSDITLSQMLAWEKGVKGKDLMIQRNMINEGARFLLSPASCVLHTGVQEGEVKEHWKDFSTAFKDHAETGRVKPSDAVRYYNISSWGQL